MIEIVVMCYAVVYVLWLLAMLACGEASRFFSVTTFFVLFPLMVVVGAIVFLVGMIFTPLVLFFSKEARIAFVRKMEEN